MFMEDNLAPRYAKLRIQMNYLQNINFSRVCEFRSKCMFKFHSTNVTPKTSQLWRKRYGIRIKYLYWFNSEVILLCHIKKVVDDTILP